MANFFNQKEGAGLPAPSSGAAYYFFLLRSYFWNIISLNVVFLLCCIPIVTIPAALSAMNRVLIKMIDQGYLLFWDEFRNEWKSSWKKSILAGIPLGIMLLVSYYLMSLSLSNDGFFGFATGAIGLMLLILAVIHGGFTFILMAVQDLPVRQIKRNARYMMVLCLKQSAGFAGFLMLWVSIAIISPWAFVILLVTGGISLMQYTMCWFLYGPIRKYILKPEDHEDKENTNNE